MFLSWKYWYVSCPLSTVLGGILFASYSESQAYLFFFFFFTTLHAMPPYFTPRQYTRWIPWSREHLKVAPAPENERLRGRLEEEVTASRYVRPSYMKEGHYIFIMAYRHTIYECSSAGYLVFYNTFCPLQFKIVETRYTFKMDDI